METESIDKTGIFAEEKDQMLPNDSNSEESSFRFDREFIIGPGLKSEIVDITPEFFHKKQKIKFDEEYYPSNYTFINKQAASFKFHFGERELGAILTGIEIDKLLIGHAAKVKYAQKLDELELNDVKYFTQIKMQYFYEEFAHWYLDQKNKRLITGINYLWFKDQDGKEIRFGKEKMPYAEEKRSDGQKDGVIQKFERFHGKTVSERGNLYLLGVIRSQHHIVGLQFADLCASNASNRCCSNTSTCCNSSDSKLCIYRLSNHQSINRVIIKNDYQKMTLFGQMVCIEDNDVMETFKTLCRMCLNNNDPSHDILPDFLDVTGKCIEGDLGTIHSVASLKRFIDHTIQTTFISTDLYDDDLNLLFGANKAERKYLLKIREYWLGLYDSVMLCKRINYYTPSFNIFSLCYLQPTYWNIATAISTFATQIVLFVMLILSFTRRPTDEWTLFTVNTEADSSRMYPGVLMGFITSLITLTVGLLVRGQIKSFQEFYFCFLQKNAHTVNVASLSIFFSFTINVVMAVLLVPVNFIVIGLSETEIELVFNAIAILFVLELDDQIVDINSNDEKSIYLQHIVENIFFRRFEKMREYKKWTEQMHPVWHRKYDYVIDTTDCAIQWDGSYRFVFTEHLFEYIPSSADRYYSVEDLPSLKRKELTFRIVNGLDTHIRLLTDKQLSENDTFFEVLLARDQTLGLRKRKGCDTDTTHVHYIDILVPGKWTYKSIKSFFDSKKRLRGQWMKLIWDNAEDGKIEMYINELDAEPTITSHNTQRLFSLSYREDYVEYRTEKFNILGNYNDIKFVQVFAGERSIEPIVFLD